MRRLELGLCEVLWLPLCTRDVDIFWLRQPRACNGACRFHAYVRPVPNCRSRHWGSARLSLNVWSRILCRRSGWSSHSHHFQTDNDAKSGSQGFAQGYLDKVMWGGMKDLGLTSSPRIGIGGEIRDAQQDLASGDLRLRRWIPLKMRLLKSRDSHPHRA